MTKEELVKIINDNPDAELMVMHYEWDEGARIGKEINILVEPLTVYNDEIYLDEGDLRERLEDVLWKDSMTDEELETAVDEELKKYVFKKYIVLS